MGITSQPIHCYDVMPVFLVLKATFKNTITGLSFCFTVYMQLFWPYLVS